MERWLPGPERTSSASSSLFVSPSSELNPSSSYCGPSALERIVPMPSVYTCAGQRKHGYEYREAGSGEGVAVMKRD